ncbi:hypothetical protein CAEBREN_17875 [Caenorhabditis brenneri]|uniref:Galactosylgalactosylxylosylprotein 3-beta-glucuronosyltransferase n=1 Tax=Caenorhabditis brenneri TaxID=135651 RepID=G0N2G3_CAEBE|nr:hypothetical protein CAEBREN_17875 [Caenorhabditis brenneri]
MWMWLVRWKSPQIPQYTPRIPDIAIPSIAMNDSQEAEEFEKFVEKRTTMKNLKVNFNEMNSTYVNKSSNFTTTDKTIIVVTPTYKRLTRIADFTRMANTLSHISNLHWIVIEDSSSIVPAIQNILTRTNLPFTYLACPSPPNFPNRGWYQRTMALKYIRENHMELLTGSKKGVVYFGDDDNSYDLRLFTEYIRNVKKIGMWGVGLVAGSLVESPNVSNSSVIGFNVQWSPDRYFAIDMAGFALDLQLILDSDVVFRSSCPSGTGALESCLLEDLGLKREDIEPFGFDREEKEVLVWHTKTAIPDIWDLRRSFWKVASPPRTNGYFVEY